MNCDEARECCHLRADGELPAARAAELEVHLSGCLECRTFAQQMQYLTGGLDELRQVSMIPSDPVQPVIPYPAARGRWMLAMSAMAAAVLAAVGLSLLAHGTRREPVRPHNPAVLADTDTTEPIITLTGDSLERYLAVAQKTSQANVHVVCLFPVVPPSESGAGDVSAEDVPGREAGL
jgi:predicted anti-sigma-YlaC factor YlaD